MKLQIQDFVYVGIQFLLFAFYVFNVDILAFKLTNEVRFGSLFIAVAGIVVLGVALLQLNKNLSPFPTPKDGSELVQNGIYGLVRHPIYSGILFVVFGYALYSESTYKLIISFLLLLLFFVKSDFEEKKLAEKFAEYSSYRKVSGRFFPKIKF
jgi:protein-S-isoprenylcysteine O-methyltransferase Ste14